MKKLALFLAAIALFTATPSLTLASETPEQTSQKSWGAFVGQDIKGSLKYGSLVTGIGATIVGIGTGITRYTKDIKILQLAVLVVFGSLLVGLILEAIWGVILGTLRRLFSKGSPNQEEEIQPQGVGRLIWEAMKSYLTYSHILPILAIPLCVYILWCVSAKKELDRLIKYMLTRKNVNNFLSILPFYTSTIVGTLLAMAVVPIVSGVVRRHQQKNEFAQGDNS